MRWDAVLQAILAEAEADTTLAGIYGDAIRLGGDTAPDQPALNIRLITDSVDELWEPMIVQWDQWTRSDTQLVQSERALRALFVHEVPVSIQGVYMWAQLEDGAELGQITGTGPDRLNLFGRAIRIRYTPIRERLRAGRSTP